MIRHLGVFVAFVAFGFVSGLGLAQVPLPDPSQPDRPVREQPNEGLEQQVIDQIKSIRKRVGGSISEQFKDLDLYESSIKQAQQEFERELIRLATQAETNRQDGPKNLGSKKLLPPSPNRRSRAPSFAPRPQSNHPNQAGKFSFSPNFPAVKASPRPGFPMVKRSSTDQLRAAARCLEELAADLEDANLYKQADQIREQARKFWLQSREFKVNSN